MNDLTEKQRETLKAEVMAASRAWIEHFNAGRVDACVGGYEPDALMEAEPFGVFRGTGEIDGFWRPFLASGAGALVYENVVLRVVDEQTVTLAADWSMNVGSGIITEERWVRGGDGSWRLRFDAFEVQKQLAKGES